MSPKCSKTRKNPTQTRVKQRPPAVIRSRGEGQVKQSRVKQNQVCQVFSMQMISVQRQEAGGKSQMSWGNARQGEEKGMESCQASILIPIFCKQSVNSLKKTRFSCPYSMLLKTRSSHVIFFLICNENPLLSCPYWVKKTSNLPKLNLFWAQKSI